MTALLLTSSLFTLAVAFLGQKAAIWLSFKSGALDRPNARRRHDRPIPILGGVGILGSWAVGVTFFSVQDSTWFIENLPSIWSIGSAVSLLCILGMVDDVKGLGPLPKLAVEGIAASIVMAFEPHVHELLTHWQETAGPIVWLMSMIWIVGVTNAINLIDGLDGLAGGMSTLVASSILFLSVWSRDGSAFGAVTMAILIPSLVAFLYNNWSPARIFMGDNGSLPVGFLLSTVALVCRPQSKSWIMMFSVMLMLGYPLLDMGLVVLRRFVKKQPLFRADRAHLHHRVLRLGLDVRQTCKLLLSIGVYLQLSALCVNFMSPVAATLGIIVIAFSIVSLLFLVRSIERWKVTRLFAKIYDPSRRIDALGARREYSTVAIDIEPLLETGIHEERVRCEKVVGALELMLASMLRADDCIFVNQERIWVVLSGDAEAESAAIQQRFQEAINRFLSLYNLQCSLASLPVKVERKSLFMLKPGTSVPAELLAESRLERKEAA